MYQAEGTGILTAPSTPTTSHAMIHPSVSPITCRVDAPDLFRLGLPIHARLDPTEHLHNRSRVRIALLQRLSPHDIELLHRILVVLSTPSGFHYSTACTGSDVFADYMTDLTYAFPGFAPCLDAQCELDETKRAYLRLVHPQVKSLFGDINRLSHDRVQHISCVVFSHECTTHCCSVV